MKRFACLLPLVLTLAAPVFAGALPKEQVAADAKWLLHFDVAQFRSSKIGTYISQEFLAKQARKPLADLKRQFKFEIDPSHIMEKVFSITAYGSSYKSPENDAVLLIRVDQDIENALVGALAGMALAGTNAPVRVEQTLRGPVSFYAIKDQICVAVLPGKVIALGKSRAASEKAALVLAGKSPNLGSSKAFSDFAEVKKAFFFLGMAEGFSSDTVLPPQARVLQMADGGRVVLGENADQLFLNLALRAKTQEVVTQMQQVIQGLVALGSLGKPDDQDLSRLINSIKVSADSKVVSVNVEYSADKMIARFDEHRAQQSENRKQ